jgi:hypothetical protein
LFEFDDRGLDLVEEDAAFVGGHALDDFPEVLVHTSWSVWSTALVVFYPTSLAGRVGHWLSKAPFHRENLFTGNSPALTCRVDCLSAK